MAQWDAIEKEEEIQESKEDDAAGHDDELDSDGGPFEGVRTEYLRNEYL